MKEPSDELESVPVADTEKSQVEDKVKQERRAQEQRHMLSVDERMDQFREMMLERGVRNSDHHHHHHIRFYVRFTCWYALDGDTDWKYLTSLPLEKIFYEQWL